ncbi:MAG: amidohydrolase family protein [Proteobacteria bacterium]|nr:amidohydrolase family protein [Pseudomonadota bacterium]
MIDDSVPQLKAPAGTCDCHIHIYDSTYPTAPTAVVTPPDASLADYKTMCRKVGIERTVLVQASAYGKDNRLLLKCMAEMGPRTRAIVVVDETVTDAELDRLTKLGARGIRFFMLAGAPLPLSLLETMAARVAPFGWTINFQCDGRELADHEARLKALPTTVTIDHQGKFLDPVEPDHPGFKALLRLLDTGKVWYKLAAPYETSKLGPPYYDDVGKLAKLLVKAAPERGLWASNWPYPMAGAKTPKDAWMLDMLLDWVPDEKTRHKILVDNPTKLYGF